MGKAPEVASPIEALEKSMAKSADAALLSSEEATSPEELVTLGDPCIGRCAVICTPLVCSRHRDDLLAPIRFRKLLRPEQKPDRSCVKAVPSPSTPPRLPQQRGYCAKKSVRPLVPIAASIIPCSSSYSQRERVRLSSLYLTHTKVTC